MKGGNTSSSQKSSVRSIENRFTKVKIEKTDEYFETVMPQAISKMESFKDVINTKFSKLEALIARLFTTSDDHMKDRMRTSFLQHETSVQERLGTIEAQVKELKDMPKFPVPGGLLCLWLDRPVQLRPPAVLGVLVCQCPTCLHPIIGQILFKEIS